MKKKPVITRKFKMKKYRIRVYIRGRKDYVNFIGNEYFIITGMDGYQVLVIYKYNDNLKRITATEDNINCTIIPDDECVYAKYCIDKSSIEKIAVKEIK